MTTNDTPFTATTEKKRLTTDHSVWANCSQMAHHAANAAESQMAIFSLKLTKWAVVFAIMVPAAFFAVCFACYGLVLLDRAADAALVATNNPAWFSPLVRGGAYFLIVVIALAPVLFSAFVEPKAEGGTHV